VSLPSYKKRQRALVDNADQMSDEEIASGAAAPVSFGRLSKTQVLDALENERRVLRKERQMGHNYNFGSMFHSDTSPSLFAFSLMRYCDVYTADVANFLQYPADHRFYPNPKILPHQDPKRVV